MNAELMLIFDKVFMEIDEALVTFLALTCGAGPIFIDELKNLYRIRDTRTLKEKGGFYAWALKASEEAEYEFQTVDRHGDVPPRGVDVEIFRGWDTALV